MLSITILRNLSLWTNSNYFLSSEKKRIVALKKTKKKTVNRIINLIFNSRSLSWIFNPTENANNMQHYIYQIKLLIIFLLGNCSVPNQKSNSIWSFIWFVLSGKLKVLPWCLLFIAIFWYFINYGLFLWSYIRWRKGQSNEIVMKLWK